MTVKEVLVLQQRVGRPLIIFGEGLEVRGWLGGEVVGSLPSDRSEDIVCFGGRGRILFTFVVPLGRAFARQQRRGKGVVAERWLR